MFLNRKKSDDKDEAARQKVISFKRFFGPEYARDVMLDLINRYYVLNPIPKCENEFERGRCEGQRDAVLYMLGMAHTDLGQLEKILKGDFT
jgi:hypothetical protein